MTRPKAPERNLGNDDEQDPDESTGSERLKAVPVTAGQEDPALVPNLIDPGGRNVKRIPEAPNGTGLEARSGDLTASRQKTGNNVCLEDLRWKCDVGAGRVEKAAGNATLRDVVTSLFSKKALNDGTWHVMLRDIMAQPEMRPFLACDL